MLRFLFVIMFFCPFLIDASFCKIVGHKKQRLSPRFIIEQKKEMDLMKGKESGDYDSLLQLIDLYFAEHRLDDVETELHDLIDEGEVRPEDIVNLERLADEYRLLCRFEKASQWYNKAEYEALTYTLMYQKDFRTQEIRTKLKSAEKILALLG